MAALERKLGLHKRKGVGLILAGIVLLVAASALATALPMHSVLQNKQAIGELQQSTIELEAILALVEAVETGEFAPSVPALSSEDTIKDAPDKLERRLEKLRKLAAGDPARIEQIEKLEKLTLIWLSETGALPSSPTATPGKSGLARTRSELTSEIRRAIAAIELANQRAIEERADQSDSLTHQAMLGMSLLLMAVVLLAAVSAVTLRQYLREQRKSYKLLAEMAEIAERNRLMEQRDDLYATITHDMKVPLLGMHRALSLLRDGSLGKMSESQSDFLRLIQESQEDLLALVDRLSEIHRFETVPKSLQITDVNVSQLVDESVSALNGSDIAAKNLIEVTVPDQLTVAADRDALRRVMVELLENALEHGDTGEPIQVAAESTDTKALIRVSNKGTPIPREFQEKIFQRFWRGIDTRRRADGSGLGLYLCQKIAEAHGGTIWCESAEDKTTFTLVLPKMTPSNFEPVASP